MTIFINERDIATLIDDGHATMGDFVAAVEAAYTDQGNGDFDILPRQNFEVEVPASNRKGSLKIGGGSLRGVGVMGASLYSGGYGGMNLWVTLYDTATGKVLAILHGSYIGQMKTGATAAMAAKHLSRADSKTVGILGSADQARTQLMGLAAVRDIETALIYSPTRAHLEAYVEWAREALPGIDTQAAGSAEEAVRGADILVTVTNAHEPILDGEWIGPGTHCSIIGAHYPKRREIDTATLLKGRVIVDDLDQAFHEKGEILIPLEAGEITRDHVKGSIGEVIVGKVPGRTSNDEITMFLSGGTALEYMGVSAMLHKKAAAAGIGQELDYEERR
jgi:alanine dehydrogenase